MENPPQNQQDEENVLCRSWSGFGSIFLNAQWQEQLVDLHWARDQVLSSLFDVSDLSDATGDDEANEVGVVGTGEGEMEVDQLNSGCLGNEKSEEKTLGGESQGRPLESGNKKTIGVRIASPLEDVSETKGMILTDATKELNVVDEEGFPQLNSDTQPQASGVTVDTNSVIVKVIQPLQLTPATQQETQDEVFGNDEVEEVETCIERTENNGMSLKDAAKDLNVVNEEAFGNDEVEEGGILVGQSDSRCSAKRKREGRTPRGENRNKKTTGKHLKGVNPTKFKRGARLRQRELKVAGTRSSKKQSKSIKAKRTRRIAEPGQYGGTSRNTSRGGLAETNIDVNTEGGQASSTELTIENEGEVVDRAFRSSLRGIMTLIKELNLRNCHKEVLKRTPFWGIFEAIIENKLSPMQCHQRGMVIIEIIKTYDPVTRKFRIGREYMELTPADMVSIFGISCGNERVNLNYCYQEVIELVARREISDQSLLSSESLKQLLKKCVGSDEKDDVEDVARLLCVYLCHTFFFATGPRVKWVYLKLIEDLDRLRDYDWNEAIINELMSSIRKYHCKPWKVTGCVMALLYWLCEHTNLCKADHPEHPLGIVKWNIPLVVSTLKEIRLKDLNPGQVVSRQANVAGTADDEVLVDIDIVHVPVSSSDVPVSSRDVPVSNRGNDACSEAGFQCDEALPSPSKSRDCDNECTASTDLGIPQPSGQALAATVETNNVWVKARYVNDTIVRFRLYRPWRMAELEQQVKKRLKLEAETYFIKYKDEVNELILMACDEDLEEYVSSSRALGTNPIEVFLVPK